MEIQDCYKCKQSKVSIKGRNLMCGQCFINFVENNFRTEMRLGVIEPLKKLHKNSNIRKPASTELYFAVGFGYTSQTLLSLLTVTPNSGKRPDYNIKSFIHVDTSCFLDSKCIKYANYLEEFVKKYFEGSKKPKVIVIPFGLSIAKYLTEMTPSNYSSIEECRQKIMMSIKFLLDKNTDNIGILMKSIIFSDIRDYLIEEKRTESKECNTGKYLVLASTIDSMAVEALHYMGLASGDHSRSIYRQLDTRWSGEQEIIILRPLRNLTMREAIIYWHFNPKKLVNVHNMGVQISMKRGQLEKEMLNFISSQSSKVYNISNIFARLAKNVDMQSEYSTDYCQICGLYSQSSQIFCTICDYIISNNPSIKFLNKII
ncbi:hypothetical protein ACR3K2_00310 [Cryptosporidium serpentis]